MLRLGLLISFAIGFCQLRAGSLPLTTKEISLMLRSGYSSETVLKELSGRKFIDAFDSIAEKQLLQAGASEDLIKTLESGVYQVPGAEKAAITQKLTSSAGNPSPLFQQSDLRTQSAPNKPDLGQPNPAMETPNGGTIYDHLKGDLVYWHNGALVPFDDALLDQKKIFLLFFSAVWSKEGRQFTTQLSDYYNRVAPQHPEFEIVFFSADRSPFAMENYVSQTDMPWPAVAFDKRDGKAGTFAQGFIHRIPRLILAEKSGRLLSDSGDNPPDFNKVLADLDKILADNKR